MGNKLFLCVGPKAIGGTYWITKFCSAYPKLFCEVRSTTTRDPRPHDPNDEARYTFLSKEEFLRRKAEGAFFETDEYNGELYGTSRHEIHAALRASHALMKITARGAEAIVLAGYTLTVVIFLVPKDEKVITRNLSRRYQALGLTSENPSADRTRAYEYLAHMQRVLMPHETIEISGTDADSDSFAKIFLKHGVRL